MLKYMAIQILTHSPVSQIWFFVFSNANARWPFFTALIHWRICYNHIQNKHGQFLFSCLWLTIVFEFVVVEFFPLCLSLSNVYVLRVITMSVGTTCFCTFCNKLWFKEVFTWIIDFVFNLSLFWFLRPVLNTTNYLKKMFFLIRMN